MVNFGSFFSSSSSTFHSEDFNVILGSPIEPYLKKFAGLIAEIKEEVTTSCEYRALQNHGHTNIHLPFDELYILRYILSEHAKKSSIITHILKAMKWRDEHAFILSHIAHSNDGRFEIHIGQNSKHGNGPSVLKNESQRKELERVKNLVQTVQQHLFDGLLTHHELNLLPVSETDEGSACHTGGQNDIEINKNVDKNEVGKGNVAIDVKQPLYIVRAMYNKSKTILQKVGHKDLQLYFSLQNEYMYSFLDKKNRLTGRWHKVLVAIDGRGFGFFHKEFDARFIKVLGENSRLSEILHPQLLGRQAAVNFPQSLVVVLKMSKRLFSKKTNNKFGVCGGGKTWTRHDAASVCPFVKKYDLGDIVPEFLGGTAKCPHYMDVPDDNTTVHHEEHNFSPDQIQKGFDDLDVTTLHSNSTNSWQSIK